MSASTISYRILLYRIYLLGPATSLEEVAHAVANRPKRKCLRCKRDLGLHRFTEDPIGLLCKACHRKTLYPTTSQQTGRGGEGSSSSSSNVRTSVENIFSELQMPVDENEMDVQLYLSSQRETIRARLREVMTEHR